MKQLDPTWQQRLETLINSMGYELVGLELLMRNRNALLRIYIDFIDSVGGSAITVDDCSKVSHQVSAMLDVEDPIPGHYTLEVSSPGVDRPLFKLLDYQKFIGRAVKIKLKMLINQRRQYKGTLTKVEGENITLLSYDSNQEVVLPFSSIDKGNLIGGALL